MPIDNKRSLRQQRPSEINSGCYLPHRHQSGLQPLALQASSSSYITAEDIAQRTGIHVKEVYRRARLGLLPCRRIGRAVRFVWAEVDEALKKEAEDRVAARR